MSDTTTGALPAAAEADQDEPDLYPPLHMVGRWQRFRHVVLRRVPVALCGELLLEDPDEPTPSPTYSPPCRRCLARHRGGPIHHVPSSTARWL